MKFYRRLRPFSVISFDLDDTLYDNAPVLQQAEQALADYLCRQWPQCASISRATWQQYRVTHAQERPELAQNMTQLREYTLAEGLRRHGVEETALHGAVEDAMEYFLKERNKIPVPAATHSLLRSCAKKYPLIAISNGNADIHRIGLSDYFHAAWSPTESLRGKPTPDLFLAAQQRLNVRPQDILHVGDHPVTDIQGAALFGAQTVWVNEHASEPADRQLTWLPTLAVDRLSDLERLL